MLYPYEWSEKSNTIRVDVSSLGLSITVKIIMTQKYFLFYGKKKRLFTTYMGGIIICFGAKNRPHFMHNLL